MPGLQWLSGKNCFSPKPNSASENIFAIFAGSQFLSFTKKNMITQSNCNVFTYTIPNYLEHTDFGFTYTVDVLVSLVAKSLSYAWIIVHLIIYGRH